MCSVLRLAFVAAAWFGSTNAALHDNVSVGGSKSREQPGPRPDSALDRRHGDPVQRLDSITNLEHGRSLARNARDNAHAVGRLMDADAERAVRQR